MRVRIGLFLLCALTVLTAGDRGGVDPRAPGDYAAKQTVSGLTVAASVVPPDQVKKYFSKDLNHMGFVVVEVAVFPEAGTSVDVGPGEFTLRYGADPTILASQSPRTVAAGDKHDAVAKQVPSPQLPGNVHVYQSTTIGYESGGYGRRGGVYTGTSTTVGVGDPSAAPYPPSNYPNDRYPPGCDPRYPQAGCPPRGGGPLPPSQPRDPQTQSAPKDQVPLRQELEGKALPEGPASSPVAGYLYFVRPNSKQKNPDYQLTWYRVSGEVRLTIPPVK